MAGNIENKKYASKYNISDYTNSRYNSFTYNNSFNKVILNLDIYTRNVAIMNVKHIKDIHDLTQKYITDYRANINRIRQLKSNVISNAPIMNKGTNVALKKFEDLIGYVKSLENDINELNSANARLVDQAWTERYKNINAAKKTINDIIQLEEKHKQHNLEMAEK